MEIRGVSRLVASATTNAFLRDFILPLSREFLETCGVSPSVIRGLLLNDDYPTTAGLGSAPISLTENTGSS
jgi:hypothetical protein